jgi:phospholipase/lecithinase/hemolysin
MVTQNIYVFSDSLSDTGNAFALSRGLVPPSPPYFNGRFSNGPVAVEQLPALLGSDYNLQQTNNYAFGGATTGRSNVFEDDVRTDLPGLLDEVDAFQSQLGTGKADPNGLYIVWAGPNDFIDTLRGSPLPDPTGAGTTFADPNVLLQQGSLNIKNAVSTLESLGAKNFVVPNVANLGRLPAAGGASAELTAISRAFNAAVDLELSNLKFKTTRVDLYSTGEAIASDPGKFGYTNITDPLLFSPAGSNPDQFFFWDQFHPTTKTHGIFADTISQTLSGKIPQPSFNQISGTNQNDFRVGASANDDMDGLKGNDILNGRQGNDRIEGWQGNDQLSGNQGDDTLSGGDGDDFLSGSLGSDIAFGGIGADRLLGQAGKDILVGDAGKDSLLGGLGADYLLGGEGQDLLQGDTGQDILNGGLGKDALTGGLGDDRLDGGTSDDRLTGNQGSDQFFYRPGDGNDVITDFAKGSDKIDLSSFRFQGFSDFTSKANLNGSLINFGSGNTLRLNQVNVATLSASDFIFTQA